MYPYSTKNYTEALTNLGLNKPQIRWNLSPAELIELVLQQQKGKLTNTGALNIDTGEFTGRSPDDRFIVLDEQTETTVNWGKINKPFEPQKFDALYQKLIAHLNQKSTLYLRNSQVCADPNYRLKLRIITDCPAQSLFCYNLFMRPAPEEMADFNPEWQIFVASDFNAVPETDGTRKHNFVIINFTQKKVIIGGTAYTGEIKKSVFAILNYLLPTQKNVLSMHCSSNVGTDNDTALFFGLSGTGKTTLSADPNRQLIGDDEHGWSDNSVFNIEGGCYAKCIDLSAEKEPQIYAAIKFGALLENCFVDDNRVVDFTNYARTENTRVSYPLHYIDNVVSNGMGDIPKNIFFLSADAFGILPPIAKLSTEQAMYFFISGYTAKVAGTEAGVKEPAATFSACFGAPFIPLHPAKYAEMLGKKLRSNNINVWLINTGWTGGSYGVGTRMKLPYTRATITAALNGSLNNTNFYTDPIFGFAVPLNCPNVPTELLNPRNTWANKEAYDEKANYLAKLFINNFKQYESAASAEIIAAAPKILQLSA